MSTESDKTPHIEASSFEEKARHRWVEAEPVRQAHSNRIAATVQVPNEVHNEFGPGTDLRPDPATVPSLLTLAATLGIPLLTGERLIEADAPDAADTEYDAPVYTDPSVLLDDE